MLAHRPLGFTGGPGGEVDVGKLVGSDGDTEVRGAVVLRVGGVDRQRLDVRHRLKGLVEVRSAALLGEHQPAPGARQRGGDALGRKVGLDGEVHPSGLEHRQHRGHPVEVALGHHRDDVLPPQTASQQRPSQPVGAGVELAVRPMPRAQHGGDGVRPCPHLLLEQLVDPTDGQLPAPPGETFDLEPELLGRQQAVLSVIGVGI